MINAHPKTVSRTLLKFRQRPWAFQVFNVILYVTSESHANAPSGAWTVWAIDRQHFHRIYADPAERKLRWTVRAGSPLEWSRYTYRLRQWAWAVMLRQKKRGEAPHKGFHPLESEGVAGRSRPPPNYRRGFRRFQKIMVALDVRYKEIEGAPEIKLFPWLRCRLTERHSFDSIVAALSHAVVQLRRNPGHTVRCEASWILRVASHRLESDGLHPKQRAWGKAGGSRRRFKEVLKSQPVVIYSRPVAIWTPSAEQQKRLDQLRKEA